MVNSDPGFPSVGLSNKQNKSIKCITHFLGLGYFSEQSFESMHHDVKVSLNNIQDRVEMIL